MTYPAPNPPMVAAKWHGGAQTPQALVMHGTVSPCEVGGAEATAHFFATEDNKTSAHYVVDCGNDSQKPVIQCVGDHTEAYHCGYNYNSIGIEMTDAEVGSNSRWNDANHTAMIARAATLAAELCLAYGIDPQRPTVAELKARGPHGIYSHNDSRLAFGNTTHTDPIGFPFAKFLAAVQGEMTRLQTPAGDAKNGVTSDQPVGKNWTLLAMDTNLNLHQAAWLSYLKGIYGVNTCWDGRMPDAKVGTRGDQLVDVALGFGIDISGAQVGDADGKPEGLAHDYIQTQFHVGDQKVRHIHQSGDARVDADVIAPWLAKLARKADILTTDSANQKNVRKALAKLLGKAWTVRRNGEYMVATRNSVVKSKTAGGLWKLASAKTFNAASFQYTVSGVAGRVVVAREPSGVQDGTKWKGGKATQAHRTGDQNLATKIKEWLK